MGEKTDKFFKIMKCMDKFFDNLHEEKVLPDNETINTLKQTKDNIKESIKKTMLAESEIASEGEIK